MRWCIFTIPIAIFLHMAKVCGIGNIGKGLFKAKVDGKKTPEYTIWYNILSTITRFNHQYTLVESINPSWLDYQTFANDLRLNHSHITKEMVRTITLFNRHNFRFDKENLRFIPRILSDAIREYEDFAGVTQMPNGKYRVQARLNKRKQHLGVYDDFRTAIRAYRWHKAKYIQRLGGRLYSIGRINEEIFATLKKRFPMVLPKQTK